MTISNLEKNELHLGFIPLNDCAPLVVAKEKGFFEKHGLRVNLHRESSWATIRDRIVIGQLDAAQMLAPMPIASSLGLSSIKKAMIVPMVLGLNGNAITVSNELYQTLLAEDAQAMAEEPLSAHALKKLIDREQAEGKPKRTLAMVFPFSMHNFQLRYWLAQAGINPDIDIHLVVVPPPQMVENLKQGHIDGFCVGEPWNSYAVHENVGSVLITGYEIWNNSPEKVLGVTRDWAEQHPNTLRSLVAALYEACMWIDKSENRNETSHLLTLPGYVEVPTETVERSMAGGFRYREDSSLRTAPDFSVFHRYAANFPWRSHAMWIIEEMKRWGQVSLDIDVHKMADTVFRPDLFRQSVSDFNITLPSSDIKPEGLHKEPWQQQESGVLLGPDMFFDGQVFTP